MNVEARQEAVEPQWQDEVVNGVYPLRRRLDGSDHSLVFLTECKAQNVPSAALKIVPIEHVTLAQLSHWRTASGLSHPHLLRLFDAGLCQLGGRQFLFVVMEYADQTLAQVLPNRALTPDEVRGLLPPTLDALSYLHGKGLVHGQLKPTNLLVVNDQLKLASDTVCPAGVAITGARTLPYDPPEARGGKLFPASDIWSLGVTLVQALTQRLPARPDEGSDTARLPTDLPSDFSEVVQRCLSRDPSSRPTIAELQAQLTPAARPSGTPVAESVLGEAAPQVAQRQGFPGRRATVSTIGLIALLVAIWGGLRLFEHPGNPHPSVAVTPSPSQPATDTPRAVARKAPMPAEVAAPPASSSPKEEVPVPPRPVSSPPDQPAQPEAADGASSSVVHKEIPAAARSALETIHGHVKVAVLVSVDRSGEVVDANLENPGPSWYFARLARDAARKWTFVTVDNPGSRTWRLRFEFTRNGATVRATPQP